jgi:uncharacterized membrane protein YgaE (UPF0421/DUF939 family)
MKFGARILKTGIAVTITMFICKLFQLEPALFGAISAVINLQPSIFLTFKTAKEQILVHLLGVISALICGYLLGGNALTMGLITIFIISLYVRLNLHSGITMGIVAALFVLSSSPEQFFQHALIRTGVIFIGLAAAMAVNIFIWPPRYRQQFKEKLNACNVAVVAYFCQAVQDYVQMEDEQLTRNQEQADLAHRLSDDVRDLVQLLRKEGALLTAESAEKDEWFSLAKEFVAYNEYLAEQADRIYELLPGRLERRLAAGSPVISPEFKAILEILNSASAIIVRVNGKLRTVLIQGKVVQTEAISEELWESLTVAIEQWQPKLTGTYYLHALLEVAVTAHEIKRASRQAKQLLIYGVGQLVAKNNIVGS